ncbi:uncharacterized protein EDB91DRAFT_1085663 [Suillus paluster]|uniref:uncharacterized protein n=1 Tax=Suillus paluster TaxID=48578 RepID=UPI001B87F93A|nr:uncharacterized protein EDB91DRAFT_1085663 [Suillus paluster]KAG1729628.1 hypothetical protein EDB91DRAFT_1085663 [Suillus paluster]
MWHLVGQYSIGSSTQENIKSYSNGDEMEMNHTKYQLHMQEVTMLLQTLLIQCMICMMPGVGMQFKPVCNVYIMTMVNFMSWMMMFITSNNALSHCLVDSYGKSMLTDIKGSHKYLYIRFQAIKRGNHSMGALYMTCSNNPHGVCYLTEETFLIMVLPGPNEPNLEQLNKIVAKFMSDMIELYGGQEFRIYGHKDKHPIHSALNSEVSNLPASCKIEGLASFSSKLFMCPQCKTPSYYLADPRGFNPTAVNSVVEFMHCVYLCMVRHVTKVIILQSGMLNPIPREDWYPLE